MGVLVRERLHRAFNVLVHGGGTRRRRVLQFREAPVPERRGAGRINVFHRDSSSEVFHTYACYARSRHADGAYPILDLVPKGRDETNLPLIMSWVRHHDRYED
jgi:predicted dithiol-disulfide oxidoreductase (DUF899 family)